MKTFQQNIPQNLVTLFTILILSQATFAQETTVEPTIPYPILVEIFDKNGDGIGDSLRITYNKKFPKSANILDSLPNYIEIFWDPSIDSDNTIGFGLGQKNALGRYTSDGFNSQQNYDFWTTGGRKIESDSIIIISSVNFSKDIKTFATSDNGILSWATYKDEEAGGVITTTGFSIRIEDRIPAIVVSATYEYKGSSSCGSQSVPCTEEIIIILSEPVVAIDDIPLKDEGGTGPALANPFAYMLKSQGSGVYEVYYQSKNVPRTRSNGELDIVWGRTRQKPSDEGDSVVFLSYGSYHVAGTDSTQIPIANDSVKFASGNFAALKDLAGNLPNPKEQGRRIEDYILSPIIENRYANPQVSFSLQPLFGNYFQISIANFENMNNVKIDVYNLKGNLVNSIAVNSSQMQIKVPASGFYIFNLNGPGISPKITTAIAR